MAAYDQMLQAIVKEVICTSVPLALTTSQRSPSLVKSSLNMESDSDYVLTATERDALSDHTMTEDELFDTAVARFVTETLLRSTSVIQRQSHFSLSATAQAPVLNEP